MLLILSTHNHQQNDYFFSKKSNYNLFYRLLFRRLINFAENDKTEKIDHQLLSSSESLLDQ